MRLYVAYLGDEMLTVFDTNTGKVVGDVKDLKSVHGVLAVPELHRLYVSTESGTLSVFGVRGRGLEKVGEGPFAPKAHSVAVDSRTHRVYLPLENVGGRPVLRIAGPPAEGRPNAAAAP